MDFDWRPEDRDFKKRVAAVFQDLSIPQVEDIEHSELGELKTMTGLFMRKLAGAGYLEPGRGLAAASDTLRLMAGQEELARISGSLFLTVETSARLFGGLLSGFGENKTLEALLHRTLRGELVGAVAVTEPAREDAPDESGTTAYEDGDAFVVQGKKNFVTNGPIADYVAVFGQVMDRPAALFVDPAWPGVSVGPRISTLGYNGAAVSSLELRRVRVPRDLVLGPYNDDSVLKFLRRTEDLILVMASVGIMTRALSTAKKYSHEHHRNKKPIFAHQEVRFKLAEMLTLLQTSQLLAFRAGWMCSTGHVETATLVRCAKVFAAEAAERVATLALQIMAAAGYVSGNPVERAYREAKYAALAGTTSELARMAIAEDLLKLHRV
ncbi:MAG TPA: acyl-CoA dehydrogenase family protein [Desulfomonilaceae bacterium]|nr:acyl-CoA dehydrogenase family protein [Desulfomonilaceae bacterium]